MPRERRAPPSGGTGDGEKTRLLILDASVAVLREHGAGGWSVPKVADVVGIQQGSITFYYPTRRDLLVATSQHIADRYAALLAERMEELDTDDDGWVAELAGWFLDDAVAPPTVEIFPELWSLGRTDPDIGAAVAGIYQTATHALVRALGHDPDDPACGELCAVVWLLSTTIEGMTAVHGHRGPDDPLYRAVRTEALALLAPRLHAAHLAAPAA